MGYGGFYVIQVGGDGEQLGGVDKVLGCLVVVLVVVVFYFNGDYCVECFLLVFGQGFLWVVVEVGVMYSGDVGLLFQLLCQLQGVF